MATDPPTDLAPAQWWQLIVFATGAMEALTVAEFAWYRRLRGGSWEHRILPYPYRAMWMRRESQLPKAQVHR